MFHLICPSLALVLVLPSLTVVAEVLLFFVFRRFFAIVLLPKCYCSSFSVDPRYDIFFFFRSVIALLLLLLLSDHNQYCFGDLA